ncbi:MAG: DUF1698 domain-containing protein [Proteobacteria bacterium]|nr:DUF1698 domain-containing protein [Pseudomonadota bacterium]
MTKEEKLKLASTVSWWHNIDLGDGIVTPGLQGDFDNNAFVELCCIPHDLTGKTVLDIGCSDGFYSFACERRGAKRVVAVDDPKINGSKGFAVAKEILGSKVEFLPINLYDIKPEEFGKFDVVLAMGLLYHLKSFYIGLEIIRELVGELLIVTTQLIDTEELIAQFVPAPHRYDHCTWFPSLNCVQAVMKDIGFEITYVNHASPTFGVVHAVPKVVGGE